MRVVQKIISLLEKRYFSASEILLNALDEHNFEKAASIIDGHPSILNAPASNKKNSLPPLHRVILAGNLASADFLLQRGADVHALTPSGNNPLGLAIGQRSMDMIQLLVSRGASLESLDGLNRSAVHCAVMNNHPEAVSFLLERGAPLDLQDANGMTPDALAEHMGEVAIADLIRSERARRALLEDDAPSGGEEPNA